MAALCFAAPAFAQTLVAHYDFTNAASTGVATDLVSGLNGTVSSSCVAAAGKCGAPNSALKFNGTGSFVTVPANASLNLTKWSVQAIVYLNGFENVLDCQVSKILQRGNQYQNNYICLEINDNNDDPTCGQTNYCNSPVDTNHMCFFAGASGSILIGRPSTSVHTGRWYCLTATYAHDTMKYYVNGALNYKRYWPNVYNYAAGGTPPMLIGKGTGSGGTTYYFKGIMDDIRIYNDALSAAQVAGICDSCNVTCGITDIAYCSKASAPLTYTFIPTVNPATHCVRWNFGDGSPVFNAGSGGIASHTFATGGTYNICAYAMDCSTDVVCEAGKCFTLCIDGRPGMPSGGSGIGSTGVANPAGKGYDQGIGNPYPNPAGSMLTIPVQGLNGPLTLTITSIDGKRILSQTTLATKGTTYLQVATQSLASGTYMLEVTAGDQKVFRKFSKL